MYEKEPVILETEVKAALKVLGRNQSPGVDGIHIELFQAMRLFQNPSKNMSTNMENNTMAYRLETYNIYTNF